MDAAMEEFVLDPAGSWEEAVRSLKKNAWWESAVHYDLEVRASTSKCKIQDAVLGHLRQVGIVERESSDCKEGDERSRFRIEKKLPGQRFAEFAHVLKRNLQKWWHAFGPETVGQRMEVIWLEQFLEGVAPEIRIYLCEKRVKTFEEAAMMAKDFVLVAKSGKEPVMKTGREKGNPCGWSGGGNKGSVKNACAVRAMPETGYCEDEYKQYIMEGHVFDGMDGKNRMLISVQGHRRCSLAYDKEPPSKCRQGSNGE
ncbi:hypothetical protein E2C01_026012 [Portunus trituberculatus]|uniref:SCAN box domain-containing protein n=1 Tax=Portunus trituberculatus TaxID=210409 RepID=A0A5B7EGZ9_PORTR|nr:hypothetical protein [Portunus trituberculatus]